MREASRSKSQDLLIIECREALIILGYDGEDLVKYFIADLHGIDIHLSARISKKKACGCCSDV